MILPRPPDQPGNTLSRLHFSTAGIRAFFFFLLFFAFTAASAAADTPKAADLVRDNQPIDLTQEKYRQLFRELVRQHNFTTAELREIFDGLVINKRVLELMDRPWEAKPYYQYAPLFLNPERIAKGKQMLEQYREVLDRIESEFGVDREIVVAIWGIESRYGANQGAYNVLQTLNTLFDAYPRRRSFFRKELIQFLLLCKENSIDAGSINGSYAGAFGQTQFIPSSYRAYAVSFDGDSKPDVWNSVPDILASIAHYLKQHHWSLDATIYWDLGSQLNNKLLIAAQLKGWRGRVAWELVRKTQAPDIPPLNGPGELSIVGLELPPAETDSMRYVAGFPNFQAITHWNHSNRYAMAVAQLAEALAGGQRQGQRQ